MTDGQVPSTLQIPIPALAELAVEWWRLSCALAKPSGAAGGQAGGRSGVSSGVGSGGAVRHALGKIEGMLRHCELEVQTLDGRPFDPGLAVHVVDVIDDASLPPGQAVIAETISPLVLWRGRVIKVSEVVTRRGP